MIAIPFGSAELTDAEKRHLCDHLTVARQVNTSARLHSIRRTDMGRLTCTLDIQVPVPVQHIDLHLVVGDGHD